jgi:1-acyl-sn-glycerol-3-phosphate acyltransferase
MRTEAATPRLDRLARAVVRPYFRLFHALSWSGERSVPPSGPAILAANHQSFCDPVMITLAAGRPVVFLGWQYYFGWPVVGRLMRAFETVPVDLDEPGPATLARMVRALREGRLCGIFPEGGRTPDGLIQPAHPGVAVLALRTGAPVVPVTVMGAYRVWPKGRVLPTPAPVSLYFGEPMLFRPPVERTSEPARTLRREVTRRIMLGVADGFARLGRPDLTRRSRERILARPDQ